MRILIDAVQVAMKLHSLKIDDGEEKNSVVSASVSIPREIAQHDRSNSGMSSEHWRIQLRNLLRKSSSFPEIREKTILETESSLLKR